MFGITSIPQVAGALAAGVLAGYLWGHVAAGASAERRQLRETVARMQQEQKTALAIQTRMAERVAELRATNERMKADADKMEESYRANPVPACHQSDAELRRLRGIIAGSAARRTAPAARQRIAPPLRLPGAVQ